jgi:outer membrane biogenesis lipoprotein LolB
MRRGASLCVLLAALLLAGCNTTAQAPPSSSKETERPPGTLPDAYKHPPK